MVRFRYKDYAHGNRKRVMTLSAVEFVRRLLLHVLPTGFVRIRHYGILSNRHRHAEAGVVPSSCWAAARRPKPESPETMKRPAKARRRSLRRECARSVARAG